MKKELSIIVLILSVVLSGCGKNANSNIENDFNQITEIASNTDVAVMDETSIPDHLEYELAEKTGRICVNADVVKDGYSNACVYKVNELAFDADYVDALAKRIFDNSDYSLELPYRVMSEDNLLSEYEDAKSNYQSDVQNVVYTYKIAQLEDLLNINTELKTVCEKKPDKMFYPSQIQTGYNTNPIQIHLEDVECALLDGKIDGRAFELSVIHDKYGDADFVWLYAENDGVRFVRNFVEYDENIGSMNGENPCDYEQSKKISDEMIGKLMKGSDYRICEIFERMILDGETNYITPNGYRFVYVPCVDEVIPSFNMYDVACYEDGSLKRQPYVCIDVDVNGFISAKYSMSLELDVALATEPNMFSFDKLDARIREYYNERLNYGYSSTLTINRVQFSYVLLETKEGSAFVPCWVYYQDKSGVIWSNEAGLCGVNALDGSVITFVDTDKSVTVGDTIF